MDVSRFIPCYIREQLLNILLNKKYFEHKNSRQDFPSGTVVRNSLANAGDKGSSPGLGRFYMPRSN